MLEVDRDHEGRAQALAVWSRPGPVRVRTRPDPTCPDRPAAAPHRPRPRAGPPAARSYSPTSCISMPTSVLVRRRSQPDFWSPSGIGPEAGADQLVDREARLGQHPAHDVLAALVQGDLDQVVLAGVLHDPEVVGARLAVLQLDAVLELLAQVARHRALDGGEVGLGHAVAGVGEAVGQLAVVGEQDEALGLGVEPADVEEPGLPVGDVVAQALPARPGPPWWPRRRRAC